MEEQVTRHIVEQNTDEWIALRRGKFTASTFADLFAKPDTKTYKNAIIKVAYERVTGFSEESYSNKWMQRGHEKEPEARAYYEDISLQSVEDAGFYTINDFVGASPDGKIVGVNGGVEFKCPSFQVYNEYLETKTLPKDYFWQVHGQILCTGWDFIDFLPYSHPSLKTLLTRIDRDENILDQLREKLEIAIKEVNVMMERISK